MKVYILKEWHNDQNDPKDDEKKTRSIQDLMEIVGHHHLQEIQDKADDEQTDPLLFSPAVEPWEGNKDNFIH